MPEDVEIGDSLKTALKRELQLGEAAGSGISVANPVHGTLRSLPSTSQFLLREPLYERFALAESEALRRLLTIPSRIDGHCAACRKETTFQITPPYANHTLQQALAFIHREARGFIAVAATCARHDNHKVIVYLRIANEAVEKVGQWPSLADILLDELKLLRTAIGKQDGAELHKAIGLAAHGVGVGSYVYLRRVFERLIARSFEENKDAVGIEKDAFQRLRMPDKIEALRNHLPPFLVRHRDVYGQLSDGIHNLNEDECLGYFDVFKGAVFMMLKQQSERLAEAKAQEDLSKAIAAVGSRAASN
jgi:hypothetical protein